MVSFTVYQNQSLSQRGNQIFFLTMLCVSFTIAFAFSWHGLWLILPFAGFEMLALGLALYFCLNRLSHVETVVVSEAQVSVDIQQNNCPPTNYIFSRTSARADIFPSLSPMQGWQLWLNTNKQGIEIGAFLSDEEKRKLANAINKAILNT